MKQKKDLGFDAIWITPVVSNTPGGYHGYWARDWFTINEHWGNDGTTSNAAEMLKSLASSLHSRGMWLMVIFSFLLTLIIY